VNKLIWIEAASAGIQKAMMPSPGINTKAQTFASVSAERKGVYYRVVIHHEAETWECSAAFDARTLDEARHRVEQIYENVTRSGTT
jgi:hypothetical protein